MNSRQQKKKQNKCKRWCFVDCLPVHSYIHVPFLSIRTPLGTTLGWPPIPPYSIATDQIHCWRVVCCPPNLSNQHWRRVPMPMAWSSVPGWTREMRQRESLKVTAQRRKRISWKTWWRWWWMVFIFMISFYAVADRVVVRAVDFSLLSIDHAPCHSRALVCRPHFIWRTNGIQGIFWIITDTTPAPAPRHPAPLQDWWQTVRCLVFRRRSTYCKSNSNNVIWTHW